MNTHPRDAKPLGAGGRPRGGNRDDGKNGRVHLTPASSTLKTAAIHAGRSGEVSGWAVRILLASIGRKISPEKRRAFCWLLSLAVNGRRISSMEAERAARCLGGWPS